MKYQYFVLLFTLFAACNTKYDIHSSDNLCRIQIIDRNGLSETISNRSRLKKYEDRDFIASQPYQQVSRIFKNDMTGKTPSILTSYYPNGQIWKYLEVSDGRAFGKYNEWHENGVLKIEAHVVGGIADLNPDSQNQWLFDEESSVWNHKGEKIASISYVKGYLNGPSKYFHPDGTTHKIVPYKNGKIHGKIETFRNKTALCSVEAYYNGEKNGTSLKYWSNGLLCSVEEFESNKLITGRYYDQGGEIIEKITNGSGIRVVFDERQKRSIEEYKNGVLEGEVREYSDEGHCIIKYPIVNSEKHGTEVQYYISGSKKIELPWNHGILHGTVKSWYKNNNPKAQTEISNHKKNGSYTCWYLNGSLMLVEEYENDTLVSGIYYKNNNSKPVSQIQNGRGIAMLFDEHGMFLKKIAYEKGHPLD